MPLTDIHVRCFNGAGLKPHLHSVAKLRMEVLREYPYFKEPDLEQELTYLRKVAACRESIDVLIFDNTTLVGASLGYPLSLENSEIQRPFKEKHLETDYYYFFGESTLLKQYRGRGIGHHFFDAREAHVSHYQKYKHICFCVPEDLETNPERPKDYIPLSDFWRKRGYIQFPDMKSTLSWKRVGETQQAEKTLCFWIKDLS